MAIALTAQAQRAVESIPGQAPQGYVEIHGVSAGEFDIQDWEDGSLHFLPDFRHPLLAPRWDGAYRNIYAPSVVPLEDGWRIFYGAWDGVDTGNDRIYSVDTGAFLDFGPRRTIIEHGPFIHVCNVNVTAHPESGYVMACTAYPVGENELNKPVLFTSPGSANWNGAEIHTASLNDLIALEGYDNFAKADINGMNALLADGDSLRLYFNDFKNFGQTFRATQVEGKQFRFDGAVLEAPYVVNDVKRFDGDGETVYLMGLHMNREGLRYALSRDGMRFGAPKPLLEHQDTADRYIVALGWVVRDQRILGVLYGAGAVPELNRNRIFARWLQKKVVLVDEDGTRHEPTAAIGPDRQVIPAPSGQLEGRIVVYGEDGVTEIGTIETAVLQSGRKYAIDTEFGNASSN